MMRAALVLVMLCLASLAPARPAWADRAAEAKAKRHYERGQRFFAQQEFVDALEQYRLAFDAAPRPELLFNIGQCHRNLGDHDRAIDTFKQYLDLVPDAPNRAAVARLIAQLEEKQAAEAPPESEEPAAPDDTEPAPDAAPKPDAPAAGADLEAERRAADERRARAAALRARPAARIDAGASMTWRALTYTHFSDASSPPPNVHAGAGTMRIAGELYPLALRDRASKLANIGLVADYDQTLALSMPVSSTGTTVPISQSHASFGARYRFGFRASTIWLDLRYAHRRFVADRDALADRSAFDAPDVSYTAVMPGLGARVPVTPRIALYGGFAALAVLSAGSIVKATNYGAAATSGFDMRAGVELALPRRFALRAGIDYTQIDLTFTGTSSGMFARGVTAATDSFVSLAATVAALF